MGNKARGWETRGVSDRSIKVKALAKHREMDPQALLIPQILREFIVAQICPYCGAGPFVSLPNHTVHQHGIYARDLREAAQMTTKQRVASAKFAQTRLDEWNSMSQDEKVSYVQRLNPGREVLMPDEHGTRFTYLRGCRCDACRAANAEYVRASYMPRPRPERTHCKNGHELTPENVIVLPDHRACRTCRNKSALDSYYRRKSANGTSVHASAHAR